MKKKVFNTKLSLNKETVSRLNYEEMGRVKGGITGNHRTCPKDTALDESKTDCGCVTEGLTNCNPETCNACPTEQTCPADGALFGL